jgi:hypothetical protein
VISGAAAQIIAKHPTFTPDQVKGALMVSTKPVEGAAEGSVGVGELQMGKAWKIDYPPNPNKALSKFLVADPSGGSLPVFDGVSWLDKAKTDVSWDSVSWDSVSWTDASWSVVSWADVSWDSAALNDVSWLDVSWDDVSWLDSSYEDAAEGDASRDPSDYELTPEDAAAVMADPEIAPDPSTLPADVTDATNTTDVTTPTTPTDGVTPTP